VRLVATFEDGAALFAAVSERGLEGVVAKRDRDPYRPGERQWVKVKNRATARGVRVPSSALSNPLETAGFSLAGAGAAGPGEAGSQPLVSFGGRRGRWRLEPIPVVERRSRFSR